MKAQIQRVARPLRVPHEASHGPVVGRELVLLKLEHDGRDGWGEAASLESYDGVPVEAVVAALEDCREVLADAEPGERAHVIAACRRVAVLPQAVAAVDLAMWDLLGQQTGEPVWRLLGATVGASVAVNHTLASADRSGAASEAVQARAAGFGCLKAKVGIGDDAGRLAAIRAAAGPEMALRVDANGAWSVAEAQASLSALEPAGIELCEEPVSGLEEIAELTGLTDVPLALDESSGLLGALDHRVCTAVGLKLSRWGGIDGLIQAAGRARASGYEVYLSSTLDGPLGIAATLHAATVIEPDRPSGLATLGLFEGRPDPLPPKRGRISPPAGPGLGQQLRSWYAD